MGEYEGLRASEYLVEAYVSVAVEWERFEQSKDTEVVLPAAAKLCETFGRLQEDGEFWSALIDATARANEMPDEIRELLADIGGFRAIEEEVLIAGGVDPGLASRLTADLGRATEMMGEIPSGNTIENLRVRVTQFREQVCEVAAPSKGEEEVGGNRWTRRVRRVRLGLQLLGGAVIVVSDGVAAVAVLPTVASMVGGSVVMLTALEGFAE